MFGNSRRNARNFPTTRFTNIIADTYSDRKVHKDKQGKTRYKYLSKIPRKLVAERKDENRRNPINPVFHPDFKDCKCKFGKEKNLCILLIKYFRIR